jgi:hypothetical protein
VDVAGLVGDDVLEELAQERLAAGLAHDAEGAEGEALDHDLHAEELEVPAAVGHEGVDQGEQVVVDGVQLAELLVDVAVEDLDVAALVDDLRASRRACRRATGSPR